jgi:hypothetical protein
MYDKNVSIEFGRCPARAMFPSAFDLLGEYVPVITRSSVLIYSVKRQDVFGGVGEDTSLIDLVADFGQAAELYRAFDKGEVGKVLFDPWM